MKHPDQFLADMTGSEREERGPDMYPTDPIHTAQHIRLMTELKILYLQAEVNADLKKILLDRLQRILGCCLANRSLSCSRSPAKLFL
jgi:hypothetical protein